MYLLPISSFPSALSSCPSSLDPVSRAACSAALSFLHLHANRFLHEHFSGNNNPNNNNNNNGSHNGRGFQMQQKHAALQIRPALQEASGMTRNEDRWAEEGKEREGVRALNGGQQRQKR